MATTRTTKNQAAAEASYDLLVLGSTLAGLGATLAAAERGEKVLLVEASTIAGFDFVETLQMHQGWSLPADASGLVHKIHADATARTDLEDAFNRLAPEAAPYVHDSEGPDDMPAHIKSTLIGATLTIPVTRGRLALGTWQGVYLCEHRDHASPRSLVLTLFGTSEP